MKYRYLVNVAVDDAGRPLKHCRFGDDAPVEPTDVFVLGWKGELESEPATLVHAAEKVFRIHNRDDRPSGQVAPSMSVGDVAVFETIDGAFAMACASEGWQACSVPVLVSDLTWREVMDMRAGREVR